MQWWRNGTGKKYDGEAQMRLQVGTGLKMGTTTQGRAETPSPPSKTRKQRFFPQDSCQLRGVKTQEPRAGDPPQTGPQFSHLQSPSLAESGRGQTFAEQAHRPELQPHQACLFLVCELRSGNCVLSSVANSASIARMGLVLKHFRGPVRLPLAGKGHTLPCSFWERPPQPGLQGWVSQVQGQDAVLRKDFGKQSWLFSTNERCP